MSEIGDFREYVEEQRHLCYGVEGTTPGVHGRIARQYDFLLETIDTYQEIEQPQLNPNQQMVLEWLKEEQTKNPELTIFGTLSVLFDESDNRFMNLDVIDALNNLSNPQQEGVFQAFSKWSFEQGGRVMATKADFTIISEPDHINLTCPRCDESFDVDWCELYQEYGEDLWMGGYGIVECTNCNEEIELDDYEYE